MKYIHFTTVIFTLTISACFFEGRNLPFKDKKTTQQVLDRLGHYCNILEDGSKLSIAQSYLTSELDNVNAVEYIDSILRNERIVFFSANQWQSNSNFLQRIVARAKDTRQVKVGLLFDKMPPGVIQEEKLTLYKQPFYDYNCGRNNFERFLFSQQIEVNNFAPTYFSPNILFSRDTINGGIVVLRYLSSDGKYFDNVSILPNGDVILDGNWNKELELANLIWKFIQNDTTSLWIFSCGEAHLYEDRVFSAASYLKNKYGVNPFTISLTTYLEMGRRDSLLKEFNKALSLLHEPSCLLWKDGTAFTHPESPKRFDLMVAFPTVRTECIRGSDEPPFGYIFGKEHINKSEDTIATFYYFKEERKKNGHSAIPFDNYILFPGESINTLVPIAETKAKKITIKVKK
jgi:hypothetical protein